MSATTKAALVVLGAAGTLYGANLYIKPYTTTHRGAAYNAEVHPEQDRG